MPQSRARQSASINEQGAGSARLLVVLLAFAWGLNWVATSVALRDVPPWSLRFTAVALGAATLFIAARLTGHKLQVPRGQRRHVMVACVFNVVAFNVLSAFAILTGATSRVVIITYSMPIWATILSRVLLGERLNGIRMLAVALCVAGLLMLMAPQIEQGASPSVWLSLGCAWCWAIATVYIKWVKADVPPLANAAWQLAVGSLLIGIGMLYFEGLPRVWPISGDAMIALLFVGIPGTGLAHFLWWAIVGRLPAVTASIGALLVPVVGVTGSTIVLGERPTALDTVGFTMIFAAAACVLLQPSMRRSEQPK